MYHFCTYFDNNYLARGLVLHQSLEEHCEGEFRLHVLCLDEQVEQAINRLEKPTIVPIRLADVEAWDADLLRAKQNRSLIEYYFTLSPVLPLYILEHINTDIVTYLDADIMFFSSPKAIYDELGDASIFITEHRFSEALKEREKFGRFNVQCQAFRNDEVGLRCLHRWRAQCLEWCYDRLEDGKFADQKYLDEWPDLYGDSLAINRHPGIGVAPWNVGNILLKRANNKFFVNGKDLVFFHFHGLKVLGNHLIKTGLGDYLVPMRVESRYLYSTYMESLWERKNSVIVGKENTRARFTHGRIRTLCSGFVKHDLLWL